MLKKNALPIAVSLFSAPVLRRLPPIVERAAAALQSKCGGGTDGLGREVASALRFMPREGARVFDVGANVGAWSEEMLRRRPRLKQLTMFEPQPACWSSLEAQADGRVALEKVALSDRPGVMEFWANENSEIASFHKRTDFASAQSPISVECDTLDLYLQRSDIPFVDFVKMDVEGHELQVLKGAKAAIASNRIGAMSFEFGLANVDSRTFFIEFWDLFESINWSIYRILHNYDIRKIDRYSRDLEYFAGVSNYIASPQPPSAAR